jgi:hypothetical protein
MPTPVRTVASIHAQNGDWNEKGEIGSRVR